MKKAFHLDSAKGVNTIHVKLLSKKCGISENNFHEIHCSQQNDNYECGLHLLVNIKVILNCYVLQDVELPFLTGI